MRGRLLIAAVLCAAGAAAVWGIALHVEAARAADLRLLERVYFTGGWSGVHLSNHVTDFFNPGSGLILAIALVGGAALARRWRQAVVAAVLVGGAELTAQVLKPLLATQRAYPPDHYMPAASWPSGHTAGGVALAIALVIVVPPAWRWVAAIVGALASLALIAAILEVATHYPSDVLGGIFVAAGWACLALALVPSAVAARLPERLAGARGDVEAA